jgi:hypothetical protein
MPELLRIKASVLRIMGSAPVDEIEETLEASLRLSRHQGARAWELRSSMDLADFWLDQGRSSQAAALLESCQSWVTEGWETLDVRRLVALLDRARLVSSESAAGPA